MKKLLLAFLLLPSGVMASPVCEVVVCEKMAHNGKIIPPALQSFKQEVCFAATVNKRAAVEGRAYKPTFRSVQTAYKVKSLYIKRVIGCINIGGGNV